MKNKKRIFGIFSLVFAGIIIIFMGISMFITKPVPVSVSTQIKSFSILSDSYMQTYDVQVSGSIQNNTDEMIENIDLFYTLISTEGETITEKIHIDKLEAHENKNISTTLYKGERYNQVGKIVRYTINSGNEYTIQNGGRMINGWAILYIIPAFAMLAVGIYFIKKSQEEIRMQNFEKDKKNNEELKNLKTKIIK